MLNTSKIFPLLKLYYCVSHGVHVYNFSVYQWSIVLLIYSHCSNGHYLLLHVQTTEFQLFLYNHIHIHTREREREIQITIPIIVQS